ncbi:MAG: internalization-related competence protein ComEC/Rec2 protein [Parcubacteria group bacterium GW2011_GWA2_51_12]|nr:MAG: internalization-related competence protein ComEC/Rec2 protein [Parcubacteria group bacterium GW2011_GWA2_51_12]
MTLGKSKIFLFLCLSFLGGVAVAKYLNLYLMAIAAIIFIILLSVFWGRKHLMVVCFCGLLLLMGSYRYHASFPNEENFIGNRFGEKLILEGMIIRDPDVRAQKINLYVKPVGFSGNILVSVGRYPEYEYGEKLRLAGEIEEPFVSDEFSYKDYLSRFDTYAVMYFPEVERLGQGNKNPVKAALLSIKHRFRDILAQILPEPHNALAQGLLLGEKRALPEDLQNALILAGVSHIVVISGYNISIITRNILRTRAWWGVSIAFWLSLATVGAFVVLTGAEASVIRAAVMGMLLVFALNVGRLYHSVNSLVLAGTVMVAINPKILYFDIGFQLSFLATLGLIYLSPILEKWFYRLPDVLGLRTNLVATLAAQAFTLPLLIFYFERISLVAPLVNVLILWTIPYAMFFSFLAGIAGFLWLPAAKIVASLPWVILQYVIKVTEFFASLPVAATDARFDWPFLALSYVLLFAAVAVYRHKKQFRYYLEYVPIKL